MAVDFSRAIKIKIGGSVQTFYGLTTVPSSHYIGFCPQNAVRYIPLQASNVTNLRAKVANDVLYAYGDFGTTVELQGRATSSGLNMRIKYILVSATNTEGGTSVDTTIKVEILTDDGSAVGRSYTTTLPANTSSKTFSVTMWEVSLAEASKFTKYRITVTCNGKTVTSGVIAQSPSVIQTLNIGYAPW